MSHPFFAYIARMRYIVRWGLMRNTMQENIQEHSHMVAVLATPGGHPAGQVWGNGGPGPGGRRGPLPRRAGGFSQGTFPPL